MRTWAVFVLVALLAPVGHAAGGPDAPAPRVTALVQLAEAAGADPNDPRVLRDAEALAAATDPLPAHAGEIWTICRIVDDWCTDGTVGHPACVTSVGVVPGATLYAGATAATLRGPGWHLDWTASGGNPPPMVPHEGGVTFGPSCRAVWFAWFVVFTTGTGVFSEDPLPI